MCECNLIRDANLKEPIKIESCGSGVYYRGSELLSFTVEDLKIDHCSSHRIKNKYGLKDGYMLIIGERVDL